MSAFEGIVYGFTVTFQGGNLLAVLLGVSIGTLIGVLPGIGPVGTMAILLPMTLKMPTETAIIMLAGIYYGSMYGGSTTSILVNVPGEACSVITCIEGYQMAKKGRAGAALAMAAVASFIAGTLGIVVVMLFAPRLSDFALSFGPPEFFSLGALGLLALSRISSGSFWRNLLVMGIGLALTTVGMDSVSSVSRYTFGLTELAQGIELVPVIMGLYGIAEVLCVAEEAGGLPQIVKTKFKELFPTREEWRQSLPAIFRGCGAGFVLGLIPGPSPIISTFASYRLEKHLSKHPEEFGKGAIEGVAGPEAANNAASSTSMVPILSLGIPFTPGTAMLYACLVIQGVQTGPLLILERPAVFWGVIASMYVGNAALLLLNFPLVGLWVSVLRIPQSILLALILLLTLVGAYSINNSLLDLAVLVASGMVGYIFRKLKLDVSPLVVALVLGPMLENNFRQSLFMSRGDLLIFLQRPISMVFLILLALVMIGPTLVRSFAKSRQPS
jgi:putative tricarboxylic transport membrane protein